MERHDDLPEQSASSHASSADSPDEATDSGRFLRDPEPAPRVPLPEPADFTSTSAPEDSSGNDEWSPDPDDLVGDSGETVSDVAGDGESRDEAGESGSGTIPPWLPLSDDVDVDLPDLPFEYIQPAYPATPDEGEEIADYDGSALHAPQRISSDFSGTLIDDRLAGSEEVPELDLSTLELLRAADEPVDLVELGPLADRPASELPSALESFEEGRIGDEGSDESGSHAPVPDLSERVDDGRTSAPEISADEVAASAAELFPEEDHDTIAQEIAEIAARNAAERELETWDWSDPTEIPLPEPIPTADDELILGEVAFAEERMSVRVARHLRAQLSTVAAAAAAWAGVYFAAVSGRL